MKDTKKLVMYGLLTAIIILMAFTPLGYLKTLGLEITFITIPVIVGAVVLGPGAGAFLGGVFGLTSFAQAFSGQFGQALLAVSVVNTFIVCVIPRILMGWCCGLIFKAFKNKNNVAAYFTASISGALLNTLFFMSALMIFFGNSEYIKGLQGSNNIIVFVGVFVGVQGLIEAAVAAVAGTAISRAVTKLK